MNLARLASAALRARWLSTLLTVLLFALGVATIVVLVHFSHRLSERLTREAQGIDLVVGAKGSPLQLILSAVFHADVPTGNILLSDAERIAANPMIAKSIPIALGDSLRNYRIVGTTPAYVAHYGAQLAAGRLWAAPLEAVLGAEVAQRLDLRVGDAFKGAHGLGGGGDEHEDDPFEVVGVLAPTGTVLDRLVLTGVDSVWAVHAHHGTQDPAQREITALLVTYRTPLATALLPRQINQQTTLQAAAPAMESARLLQLVGVGSDAVRAFAGLLIGVACLSVFVALYNALNDRRYDLAVMRTLGATPGQLLALLLLEGWVLAALGALTGLLLGHLALHESWRVAPTLAELGLTGGRLLPDELSAIGFTLLAGLAAALLPAISAYRTDVAAVLARGR